MDTKAFINCLKKKWQSFSFIPTSGAIIKTKIQLTLKKKGKGKGEGA